MRKLSKQKRLLITKRALRKLDCLKSYTALRLVAQGNDGIVFSDDGAVIFKLQILQNEAHFLREVAMQREFAPHSPVILHSCIEKLGAHKFGVVIMEKLDCTLDVYLGSQLSLEELGHITSELAKLLKFSACKRLVHGDLALFNIGVRMKPSLELVFIDFGMSKDCSGSQLVDQLRIAIECFPQTRSRGTKPVIKLNMQFVLDHLVKFWFPQPVAEELDKQWETEFNKYKKNVGL